MTNGKKLWLVLFGSAALYFALFPLLYVSPEEKAAAEARHEARHKAWADSVKQVRADSLAQADSLLQAQRRMWQAELQKLVAQAYEAEARGWGGGETERQKARDARRDLEYAWAIAARAEVYASNARDFADNGTAEEWRELNRAAELWDRVVYARNTLKMTLRYTPE